jgi:hypothetical protein
MRRRAARNAPDCMSLTVSIKAVPFDSWPAQRRSAGRSGSREWPPGGPESAPGSWSATSPGCRVLAPPRSARSCRDAPVVGTIADRCLLGDAAGIHHSYRLHELRDHPRSCVIRIIDMPRWWRSSRNNSSTCACTVTSSAVVGRPRSAARPTGDRHRDHHPLPDAARTARAEGRRRAAPLRECAPATAARPRFCGRSRLCIVGPEAWLDAAAVKSKGPISATIAHEGVTSYGGRAR